MFLTLVGIYSNIVESGANNMWRSPRASDLIASTVQLSHGLWRIVDILLVGAENLEAPGALRGSVCVDEDECKGSK